MVSEEKFCVGLTGGIATGKSTVAKLFKERDIDVISADHIARALTAPQEFAYEQIKAHFGSAILDEQGHLNRRHLRQLIFNNPKQRLWLEGLLHPLIRQKITLAIAQSTSPYCLIEIPLLKEKQSYPYLKRILVVYLDANQQLARLKERDALSDEEARAIIASQISTKERLLLADDRIDNHLSYAELTKIVGQLHQNYLLLSQKK